MAEIEDCVLELGGSLDARSTPEIRSALHELLSAPGKVVVVDLGAVTSADVVALRVIAAASRLAALRGGRIILRATPGPVRRLLTVSRLARLVEVERTPGEPDVPRPRGVHGVLRGVGSATPETA